MSAKLLKQEEQLAVMERHMDRYAHEMQTSTGPEYEYYENRYREVLKEKQWLKFRYFVELRREILHMKRRINRGEKGLKSKRNQLKRKYFEMYS
jgi:flagella basal body P-ring formation protein FlgA